MTACAKAAVGMRTIDARSITVLTIPRISPPLGGQILIFASEAATPDLDAKIKI